MSLTEITSQKNQISNFLNSLEDSNEEIFPYLANRNWKKGKQIFYSGPYWKSQSREFQPLHNKKE